MKMRIAFVINATHCLIQHSQSDNKIPTVFYQSDWMCIFLLYIYSHLINFIAQVLKAMPELRHFDKAWPIHTLVQQYLKNMSERARVHRRRRETRIKATALGNENIEMQTVSIRTLYGWLSIDNVRPKIKSQQWPLRPQTLPQIRSTRQSINSHPDHQPICLIGVLQLLQRLSVCFPKLR